LPYTVRHFFLFIITLTLIRQTKIQKILFFFRTFYMNGFRVVLFGTDFKRKNIFFYVYTVSPKIHERRCYDRQ